MYMYIHALTHRLGRLLSRRIVSAALAIIVKHILKLATFSSSILHHFIQHYDSRK